MPGDFLDTPFDRDLTLTYPCVISKGYFRSLFVDRKGVPSRKKVCVDFDKGVVTWGSMMGSSGEVTFQDIHEVVSGKSTKVFKDNGHNANEHTCFSLLCDPRCGRDSVDLEAKTRAQRDSWVEFLKVCVVSKSRIRSL